MEIWNVVLGTLALIVGVITLFWVIVAQWKSEHDRIRDDILNAPQEGREVVWSTKTDSEIIKLLKGSGNSSSEIQRNTYQADRLGKCSYNRFISKSVFRKLFA